jgi:hypothetical protein
MPRRVRGVLFVDYVRMMRGRKDIDWTPYLELSDAPYLDERIDPAGWYPMESFERFGVAIGREIVRDQLDAVRMWGRFQVDGMRSLHRDLVAEANPRETLMRFQVLRKSFFDFDAVDVVEVGESSAGVVVSFQMGAEAEEKACHQTLGFFERLIELSGGQAIHAVFREQSWKGDPRTLLVFYWRCGVSR